MVKNEGIFLGVSLMTTDFYSKARIRAYAKWSLSKFGRFLVVIADLPEETNWVVIKGISKAEAKSRINTRTENLKKGYLRALKDLDNTNVISATELSFVERYDDIFSLLSNGYEQDKEFMEKVNSTIHTNLSGLLASIDTAGSIIESLAPYVLHEYAISILLKWYYTPSYSAQVSPKPDALMKDVLCGRCGSILNMLGITPESYEYITKTVEED